MEFGHVENTSIPGSPFTHSVFAAHSGMAKAKYFDELDKLELGDTFSVTILDNTYEYKVDDIRTVEKNHLEELKIEDGKEYVTLITCVPLFINSHRLLVRGIRINDVPTNYNIEENTSSEEQKNEFIEIDKKIWLVIIVIFALFIAGLVAQKKFFHNR